MDSTKSKSFDRSQISTLQAIVGPDCEILSEATDTKFQEYAKRWTDTDREIPGAIVLPRTEAEIQKLVR